MPSNDQPAAQDREQAFVASGGVDHSVSAAHAPEQPAAYADWGSGGARSTEDSHHSGEGQAGGQARRDERASTFGPGSARAPQQAQLMIVPVTFSQASAFVADHHRHHKPPPGTKFVLGVARVENSELVGVAMVGRPVARHFDDGLTLEVNRTCTDGTENANSALYGAAWRAASALGYRRLITYTQAGESGASLRGAGWKVVAERPARGSWAESSVKLRSIRDRVGNGGVQRTLWETVA